jgi:hypothetical protein
MVLRNAAFAKGDLNTGFIGREKLMEALDAEAKAASRARAERAAVLVAALTRAPGGGIRGVHHRQTAPKPLAAAEATTPAWAMRQRRL